MQISPVQRRLTPTCDAPTFHVSRRIPEGRPAFVLEHASPSAEPRPPEHPVVRLSVSLGEDRRRRGTKSSPVRVKVSPPIPLSSAQTESESGLSAHRRPMGVGRPKIFISHLCSSVSFFGYCLSDAPGRSALWHAVLCGNFSPRLQSCSGSHSTLALRVPRKYWNSWGQLCPPILGLSQNGIGAQYVRSHPISIDLHLHSGLSRDMTCFYGENIYAYCIEICLLRGRTIGRDCLAKRKGWHWAPPPTECEGVSKHGKIRISPTCKE